MQKLWVLKRDCIINGSKNANQKLVLDRGCKINGSKNANQKLVLDRGCKNARSKCANQKVKIKNDFNSLYLVIVSDGRRHKV